MSADPAIFVTGNRNRIPAGDPDPDSTCSHDADDAPTSPPRRARDYKAEVIALPGLARARFGTPVAREADGEQPAPKFRSPFTEDHPSPRCVWEDYKAGAAHFCSGMPLLYGIYWPVVFPPLVLNMFAASLHVMSVRPSYFWGATLIALLILLFAH